MITTVTYNRTYAIGPFLNEKIGVEVSLGENQCPLEALSEAKKLCDTFHIQANPQLDEVMPFDAVGSRPFFSAVQPLDEREIEKPIGKSMVDQINSCDELKVLESYHLLVRNNEEWASAYKKRRDYLEYRDKISIEPFQNQVNS